MRLYWDIEASGLLDASSVDYTQSPYKLKEDFKVHCAVFVDVDTMVEYTFVGEELSTVREFLLKDCDELIAHNSISYDQMVMKAAFGITFEIGVFDGEAGEYYDLKKDSLCGKPITITDTLVMSKTLNPDRPQHSLDYFGRLVGDQKIDWRAKAVELGLITHNAPKGAEFKVYHPEMLTYNKQDCKTGIKAWKLLLKEWGKWDWKSAYELEKYVAFIITHQEHRGFAFNSEAAVEYIKDLDTKMEELRNIVEPIIPMKPIGKTAAKEYIPCAVQFKKNGEPSANIEKWIAKHEGKLEKIGEDYIATIFGKEYKLPIPQEPIITTVKTNIRDTTFIKGWLVTLGWKPTQYKERDLTVDSKKKKITQDKFIEVVERYVEQTLSSPFCKDRCEELGVTPSKLKEKLLKHDISRPLKVYTNPTLTVGMEKEICPNLLEMTDKFEHTKEIVQYLTYSHRRNSILGGNVDPEDEDDMEKGWLSCERLEQDGRIPTPADTCGAGTSRFKHRLVANVPRVSSLYGKEMRSLFGADVKNGYIQMGYDFDSLEAKIESHYVYKYEGGKEYGISLTAEKPNDCHSVLAKSISGLLGRPFPRGTAKNVKYGCSYNAQPPRVAKTVGCSLEDATTIFNAFWSQAYPLKMLKENMQKYWETTGCKKFLLGIDGRKLPIRSKGNVINTAFQSAGVICAKRAMVIHYQKLKKEGLTVDFWTEDWKNKPFVQQMIAYHDEAQSELSKNMVTWKMFSSEEEAKLFKKSNTTRVWSDIGHSDKGWYVGYCRAGELAVEAVKEAGEYYKLNVELTAGYILGRNWAECH